MPLIPGAPKLPKTDDNTKVYNASYVGGTNPVFASPGMANSIASTADLELYRQRREVMIARGEDPDAAAKNIDAKHQARKDAVKQLFGMKSKSENENEIGAEAQTVEGGAKVHHGGTERGLSTSEPTDSVPWY